MYLSYINKVYFVQHAKVHKKIGKKTLFSIVSLRGHFVTFFNNIQIVEYQQLTKMLQKTSKKIRKKSLLVLKKCVPLQRFNKLMIVLQI